MVKIFIWDTGALAWHFFLSPVRGADGKDVLASREKQQIGFYASQSAQKKNENNILKINMYTYWSNGSKI